MTEFQAAADVPKGTLRPFLRCLSAAASQLGGRLELDMASRHISRFTPHKGPPTHFVGNALGLNSDAAAMLAADKQACAGILRAAGLPAPMGELIFHPDYAEEVAQKRPNALRLPGWPKTEIYPCYVKPNTGREGRGVTLCMSDAELRDACQRLFETDHSLRVEPAMAGQEARVLVLDGTARLGFLRRPFQITGDGILSVADLTDHALRSLSQSRPTQCPDPQDPRIDAQLTRAGLTRNSILPKGKAVALMPVANQSLGGEVLDLTAEDTPALFSLALDAACALGLRWAGVDLIWDGDPTGAVVLEVNSSPGLDAYIASSPQAEALAQVVLTDALDALR